MRLSPSASFLVVLALFAGCLEAPAEMPTEEAKMAATHAENMTPAAPATPRASPTVWSPPSPAQYDFGPEPTVNESAPMQATPTPPAEPAPASPTPTPQPEPVAPAKLGDWINGTLLNARWTSKTAMLNETGERVLRLVFEFETKNETNRPMLIWIETAGKSYGPVRQSRIEWDWTLSGPGEVGVLPPLRVEHGYSQFQADGRESGFIPAPDEANFVWHDG